MNFLEELNNEISVVIKCKISKFIKEELPDIFEKSWDNANTNITNHTVNITNKLDVMTKDICGLINNISNLHGNTSTSLSVVEDITKKIEQHVSHINNTINNSDNENVFLEINE